MTSATGVSRLAAETTWRARWLQALRGHVIREMDRELEAAISAAYDREDYQMRATERGQQ